jgi:alginate O-acetyltransferase complex protein AlgI
LIFNSFAFLVFFVVTYALYRLAWYRFKLQNRLLLIASYVFYGYWDWRFLPLLVASTVVDYYCGKLMVQNPTSRKHLLLTSIVVNIGILFVFKYFEFFQGNFVALMNSIGLQASPLISHVLLPLGISFYTFQKMTYAIDIYEGKIKPTEDFFDFALFVSFFPLLLSGPIERARNLLPQIGAARIVTKDHLREGVWLITWGLFKKVYIADNVAPIANGVFASDWNGSGAEALVGTYAYAVQIYCDFSGYSDIAQGLAIFLGFEVMRNFNFPYFARNPSDFWRRWHISLSTWLREYVYIPLGGSRVRDLVTYRNFFITMLLVGLWHGAAWAYVLWGSYHGCLLIAHRLLSFRRIAGEETPRPLVLPNWLAILSMFHLTCLGWLMFRAESLQQIWNMLSVMFTQFGPTSSAFSLLVSVLSYAAILVIVQCIQRARDTHYVLQNSPVAIRGMVYGVLFYLMAMHGGVSESFIYSQF